MRGAAIARGALSLDAFERDPDSGRAVDFRAFVPHCPSVDMRFLLDTTVISELVRPNPSPRVVEWICRTPSLDLALSVLTLGQLAKGVASMPPGGRQSGLESWLVAELPRQFSGRMLAVDESVALGWGRFAAAARETGRPLPVIDGLLLATASVHRLVLVTRNSSDCEGRGVPTLNPWEPGPAIAHP
ncbi:MAG TPA: type II toxin-antitoxin system VapC family toxin [Gemmatimonadales bacterium]|nr:type II toxin-antitoxin system VapC family toxin [Gemmatimonadales bacterium]